MEFVAIGEWDITSIRLPFIVVGFYHENESGRSEEAISRSALAKVLGTREGEKLVVESIVGNTDMSLKEALKSQISPGTQEHSSNNDPLVLPYREQAQPWWFQPTPQHYGLNGDSYPAAVPKPLSTSCSSAVSTIRSPPAFQTGYPSAASTAIPLSVPSWAICHATSANSRFLDDEKQKLPGCKFDGGGGTLRN